MNNINNYNLLIDNIKNLSIMLDKYDASDTFEEYNNIIQQYNIIRQLICTLSKHEFINFMLNNNIKDKAINNITNYIVEYKDIYELLNNLSEMEFIHFIDKYIFYNDHISIL
jgi:hypothetical protein